MSFVEKLARSAKRAVNLIVAPVGEGKTAWYFLHVHPAKSRKFNQDVFSRGVTLTDYGDIVASGYGDTPPQAVIDEMAAKHGFKPE